MKNLVKISIFLLLATLTFSCSQHKEKEKVITDNSELSDSLRLIIEQKENEMQDMLNTINEIHEGFRQISAAEGRVTLAKNGEGVDRAAEIKENIAVIAQKMRSNRELIEKLQKQAREASINADVLRTTIDNLTKELEDKNKELEALRAELAQKDVRITELDNTVSTLNDDVANLKTESQQLSNTVSNQDKQLNTAWYAFGTKKELKENHILESGDVLRSNFNKSYFTKVDIRVDREIKLYSKSAKVLSNHPASSYTLQPDASKQYVLRITDPTTFWSTSKYLVIQVK